MALLGEAKEFCDCGNLGLSGYVSTGGLQVRVIIQSIEWRNQSKILTKPIEETSECYAIGSSRAFALLADEVIQNSTGGHINCILCFGKYHLIRFHV
jgi:hypothetical protein